MTLAAGDLTTPARFAAWVGLSGATPANVPQLISSMTALIYNKLNRARLYSQPFVRTFDGTGTYQLVLPDWPVTAIASVQLGAQLINAFLLPNPVTGSAATPNFGYGYRAVPWAGNLPGDPAVLEFVNGVWCRGPQNLQVKYTAGYAITNEAQTVPASPGPYTVQVLMPQGIWCRDGGVVYAATGVALTPVTTLTGTGQYIVPPDTTPGLYTFDSADAGANVLISYSFIPADLEEACIQMVAERRSYAGRIGELSKSLGGQETISFLRGSRRRRDDGWEGIPPEVVGLIEPYVSVLPPAIGAPV